MMYQTQSGSWLELISVDNHQATGQPCADIVEQTIRTANGCATICFSTGDSPLPTYRELVTRYQNGALSFAKVRAFLLDEYIGLPAGHPACFRTFMENNLYSQADFPADNLNFFFGPLEDHMQTCYRFEQELKATGGVDLMMLGIGTNGHIAFNEPGTLPESRTRLIKLSESTRKTNARFFPSIEEVPSHALSVGIATILEAKKLLLVAAGKSKAEALQKAFQGPVDNQVPASHLQSYTGELVVVTDQEAASLLKVGSNA